MRGFNLNFAVHDTAKHQQIRSSTDHIVRLVDMLTPIVVLFQISCPSLQCEHEKQRMPNSAMHRMQLVIQLWLHAVSPRLGAVLALQYQLVVINMN